MNLNITKLQGDVEARDQQIDALKARLEELINAQPQNTSPVTPASESTQQVIAALQERIKELEAEKAKSEQENSKRDQRIEELENKLAEQESMFKRMMQRFQSMIPGAGASN